VAANKIQMTRDYRMFTRNPENRPIDARKHRKLKESMEKYGFLKCFPVVVNRRGNLLTVKDGQHRLMFAAEMGLPVWWVEEEVDFDVADINCTSKVWVLKDYAMKYAANGVKAYAEGLEFAQQYGLSVGTAFALLAGTTSFNNCQEQFIDGTFKVKDRPWADTVAGIYGPLVVMSSHLKNTRFIEACMAVCRVPDFDPKRLLQGAARCREKLVSFSTRDAYLDMVEEVYNYGRKHLVGLKALAMMAMRERNVAKVKKASPNGKAAVTAVP
jgi:hypothetical protein